MFLATYDTLVTVVTVMTEVTVVTIATVATVKVGTLVTKKKSFLFFLKIAKMLNHTTSKKKLPTKKGCNRFLSLYNSSE